MQIAEDSEEEELQNEFDAPPPPVEREDAREEEGEESDMVGGLGELGSVGQMTASGSGGHRLNTLEGAPGRQLPLSLGGTPGQDDEDDDDDEDDEDAQQQPPEG